jgi:flagellar motor switch protein FliN
MSNLDRNSLNEWLSSNQDSITESIQDVLNQKSIKVSSEIPEDLLFNEQALGEEYPLLGIQFSTSEESSNLYHIFTLGMDSGSAIYSMMSGKKIKEFLPQDHSEILENGIEKLLLKTSELIGKNDTNFSFKNVTVSVFDSAEEFSKALPENGGVAAIHKLIIEKDVIQVYQYSWGSTESADDFVDVSQAEFDTFTSENGDNGTPRNIDMLLDVELEVLVELGRKSMKIQDVLKLGKGSLIELDKSAGEPLTIYVNNRKLAEGEVVVVDDNFGIRITKLASTKERIKSLG